MKTMTKLVGLACILSMFTALLALYALSGLGRLSGDVNELYARHLKGLDEARAVNISLLRLIREEKNLIIADNESELAKYVDVLKADRQEYDGHLGGLPAYFASDQGKGLVTKLQELSVEWLKIHDEVVRLGNTTDAAQSKKAQALSSGTGQTKAKELADVVQAVVEFKMRNAKKAADDSAAAYSGTRLIAVLATLLSVILGVGLGFLVSRDMLRQLGDEPGAIAQLALRIAGGDLDVQFDPARAEVGVFGAMKQMVATLKGKIAEAEQKGREAHAESERARVAMAEAEEARRQAERAKAEGMLQAARQLESIVEVVTSASEELSAQIEQSSHGAEEQSHRVSETATAMEEMNATVLEVAKNAQQAAETSDQARQQAQEGADIVGGVVKGISEVREQSQALKTDMAELGKQAEGIGQIMNVISDIADQTNLLALNAAIEAARAGDAGRGFAVVADEVRKLAEKTMAATREVGDSIRGIQDGTRRNMEHVDRSAGTIESATGMATRSGESLQRIVALVDQASDQVRSIATASEQQSAASEEINRSVEQVATISAETAQAMGQASQAVSELARQAQVLQSLINEMKAQGQAAKA
jgi:methyl-accepting chemotaxis protein